MQQKQGQRLVLHVGPHKTATTYLQANFAIARLPLSRAGWLYPKNVGIQPGIPEAHHDLSYRAETYFWPGRENHDQLTALASRLQRNGKHLLLSAEGFSMWALSQFHRLADILGFAQIEIVYALRDPMALLQSYWAEEVKQGMTASLADRVMAAMLDPMRARLLNPLRDLNPLIASDRVILHLVPFELLKAEGTDMFTHICDRVLGVGPLAPKLDWPVNVGFPIEQTEFLRLMALIHGAGAPDIGPALRMAFVQKTTPAERAGWNAQIRTAAADALRQQIVPADALFRLAVEKRVTESASAYCTLPLPQTGVFNRQDIRLVSYDSYGFWHNQTVQDLAQQVLARLGPAIQQIQGQMPYKAGVAAASQGVVSHA